MESPLERIAFLARSENRLQILQTLADEERTRQELREKLAISRTTLARILNEFETRGLIERTEQRYRPTPAADSILAKFLPLLETVEGIQNLGNAIDWLPPPARSLEFRHFRDAEITTSTAENPAEPFDRGVELIRAADEYRGLTSTAIPRYVKVLRDEEFQDVEGVIEARFIETLRKDPKRAAPWYDLIETTWIYDGRVPINMHIVDETVLIWLGEARGNEVDVRGLLETKNETVVSWANSFYNDYRSESRPLDPGILPTP